MPYRKELIPENQKDNFAFPVQVSRSGRKPTLYKWVVDSANESFLVQTSAKGGAYSGTLEEGTFCFHIYNEDVFVNAIAIGVEQTEENKLICRWKITEIRIPFEIEEVAERVVGFLIEAFQAWGDVRDGESYYRVDVDVACDVSVQSDSGS